MGKTSTSHTHFRYSAYLFHGEDSLSSVTEVSEMWKVQVFYLLILFKNCNGQRIRTSKPKTLLEELHVATSPPLSEKVNGTELPDPMYESPDYRLEEESWFPHNAYMFLEEQRPYRFSPFFKQLYRWDRTWYYQKAHATYVGCYCTTVYKRLTLLAGCAALTRRHILTTATSTELVLQHHKNEPHLHNILGVWYDHNGNVFNSSLYATPARIHYHPQYLRPHQVNLTHPLPFRFDLAVWTTTTELYWRFLAASAVLCARGGPHGWQFLSSTPRESDLALIVGFQYVKSQRKIPMPWFRYVTRTRKHTVPCPKTEWNWYHCVPGPQWGRYGVESGAAWHRALEGRYWLYDGLIGMCAFSMKLRSEDITHYFTVLNTHPVLDFLYNSYMGRLPYEYLDSRYENTQWRSPIIKPGIIDTLSILGERWGVEEYNRYAYRELPWKVQVLYILILFNDCNGQRIQTPKPKTPLEELHVPTLPPLPEKVNGTELPDPMYESPDYRLEEESWFPHNAYMFLEEQRPYRFSPFFKQLYRWDRTWYYQKAHATYVGCYCTTVYKRLTLLAGCAVLTRRHILTTATSTELVLQHHKNEPYLHDILGVWYDHNGDVFNSSIYTTPARIHYHPEYLRPHQVNLTHPLPFRFDLAVWTTTTELYWRFLAASTVLCARGGPHGWQFLSSTPRESDLALIVGFQYVKSQRKIPMPWFRYVTRTRKHTVPCPKTEWNWYHCVPGPQWGRYGVESGAAWHRALEGRYWLYDGLIGMCAFSMKLRSEDITHYFTVLNTHRVLDFLYNSYMGRLPYEYLDSRYENTQWRSPIIKPGFKDHLSYLGEQWGTQDYNRYGYRELPWYK